MTSLSRRRVSVGTYVLLSFGLCLVALGLVIATTSTARFRSERRHAREALRAAAQYNADLEVDGVEQTLSVLAGIADTASVASLDPAKCVSAFESLGSIAEQGSVYLLDASRRSVCELLLTRRPVAEIPAGTWFEDALASDSPIYGGIVLERSTGTPKAIFASRVAGEGQTGVLAFVLDSAAWPLEVPPNTAPETVIVELDRGQRVVIAHSPDAPVEAGVLPRGSWLRQPLGDKHTRTDADGVVRIYEQVALENLDRVVLAGVPRSVALQAAQEARNRNLLLGGAIAVLVTALGTVVHRRIARPIARLQSAIRDAGDDGSLHADPAGPAEIAALADEFNATMEKRRELEADLAESVIRAEDASRMKSLFLANVSHEIRTPMNGVLGLIALLRDEQLSAAQRDLLDTMDDSATALLAIINDLLDFSKIEAGMLEVDSVDFPLAASVRAAVAAWVPVADDKGVTLSVTLDPSLPERVNGDPLRLRQVLSNLVDNAVKFTLEGAVTVRVLRSVTGNVRFEVSDSGIGIGSKTAEELFEAFVQGDPSTTRRFGGTGLGLAICKQLVTLMDGVIGAVPRSEGGSIFSFELPLQAAATTAISNGRATEELAVATAEGCVLLAEDNAVNQRVAAAMIRQMGFDVDVANNGAEAVELLASGDYVVVLMDLQMPVMDGFEATAEIRKRFGHSVPVFALSASVLPADRARCEEVGMNGHLAKPIDRGALRSALLSAAAAVSPA